MYQQRCLLNVNKQLLNVSFILTPLRRGVFFKEELEMKEFILKFQVGEHKIDFSAPVEMIFAGFKISYLVPEPLSAALADIVKDNLDNITAKELQYNDCLEEILMSLPDQKLNVVTDEYILDFKVV